VTLHAEEMFMFVVVVDATRRRGALGRDRTPAVT